MAGNSVVFFAAGHVSIARGIVSVQSLMALVKDSCAERSGCGQ